MNQITLRPVKEEDFSIMYKWRNDPNVRKMMFNTAELELDEHISFWNNRLHDKSSFSFMVFDSEKPIGVIRLDKRLDLYEIDILISPEEQGRGIGKRVLEEIIAFAKNKNIKKLSARIKPENQRSKQIFQRNGFKEVYSYYEWESL